MKYICVKCLIFSVSTDGLKQRKEFIDEMKADSVLVCLMDYDDKNCCYKPQIC